LELKSEYLATPLVISSDRVPREVWFVEVQGRVAATHVGSGVLVLGVRRPRFNEFGDATTTDGQTIRERIKLRPARLPQNNGRRVFEVLTSRSDLSRRFYVVFDEGANEAHRLLDLGRQTKPIEDLVDTGAFGSVPIERRITLPGTPATQPTNGKFPLRNKVSLRSPYHIKQGYYEIVGELGGQARITHDQNTSSLNAFGDETMTTLALFMPFRATLRELKTVDPLGKGRRLFLVDRGAQSTMQLYLVMSPDDSWPHRLILREGPQIIEVLPLFDPYREEYARNLALKLDSISEDEAGALGEITRIVGYDLSWESSSEHVTKLSLTNGSAVDAAMPYVTQLSFLESLYLDGHGLGDEALLQLRSLKRLKTIDLQNTLVQRSTVDELRANPNLKVVAPDASVRPDERAVAAQLLAAGVRLITDDSGHVISAEDDYGTLVLPVEPREILLRLQKLPMLRSFSVGEMGVGKDDLHHVGRLTQLEYLDLGPLECDDDDLAAIETLPRLKMLRLGVTGLTKRGWDCLREMKSLETLQLGVHRASDSTLSHLGEPTALRSLSIEGDISDSGLRYIEGLNDLERLWIYHISSAGDLQNPPRITSAAVRQLKQALPNATIHIQESE
jgi:hypothetical protein